jgi:hypothetical protein
VAPRPPHSRLPPAIFLFWAASVAALWLTVAIAWIERRAGLPRGLWDPFGDPLFQDFMDYPATYTLLHTRAFFFGPGSSTGMGTMFSPVAYPPFAAVVLAWFYSAGCGVWGYLGTAGVWLAGAAWGVRRALLRAGLCGTTATLLPLTLLAASFPILRLLHEGNIELAVWILTALGTYAWMRDRNAAAAVLFGLAGAMKLYPLALLILLVERGRWRAAAGGLATFIAASWASLWWLGPSIGIAWQGSLRNVFGYQGLRAGEWTIRELAANHSAFEWVKVAARVEGWAVVMPAYYAAGLTLFAAAWFARLRYLSRANRLLAVTVFMLLLPPVSYFHALVHLYAPLVVLLLAAIDAQRQGKQVRALGVTHDLILVTMSSFTLMTFPRFCLFGGLIQGLALAGLFGCAILAPFESSRRVSLGNLQDGSL